MIYSDSSSRQRPRTATRPADEIFGGVCGMADDQTPHFENPADRGTNGVTISPDAMIPDLLAQKPHLRPVFDQYGLQGCGGPHGPAETVAYFARVHDVEIDRLLRELEVVDRTAS
ncbi:MAG: DUF1858 domain-containing protein, partial [Candidatus Eisenbacteria bacterium]|nr:DUF1858 domain-containing protein [Candidatus Eisenbacteria bacterium]